MDEGSGTDFAVGVYAIEGHNKPSIVVQGLRGPSPCGTPRPAPALGLHRHARPPTLLLLPSNRNLPSLRPRPRFCGLRWRPHNLFFSHRRVPDIPLRGRPCIQFASAPTAATASWPVPMPPAPPFEQSWYTRLLRRPPRPVPASRPLRDPSCSAQPVPLFGALPARGPVRRFP